MSSEPFKRFIHRASDRSLWVGSYVDGKLFASATGTLTRTQLDIAVLGTSATGDPGLLPALCDWSTARGVDRVVVAVLGTCDDRLLLGAGFTRGADFVTYSRPLDAGDDVRRHRRAVREVAVDDADVARLAETGLPDVSSPYRPSGSEIIAAAAQDSRARAWVVGTPAVGVVITHVTGTAGVVALIVRLPGAGPSVCDDLLAEAMSAMSRDGADTMHSIVEATNDASHSLNLRYQMQPDGGGVWWHRRTDG